LNKNYKKEQLYQAHMWDETLTQRNDVVEKQVTKKSLPNREGLI